MSSLNEISTDQLGNRVVVTSDHPSQPFSTAGFWLDFHIEAKHSCVYRKAFLGPLYKEVEYLAKLEQQAKEAGHKRWDHRIKIHRRGISY